MPVLFLNISTPLTLRALSKLTPPTKQASKKNCTPLPPPPPSPRTIGPQVLWLRDFRAKKDCLRSTLFIKHFTLTSRGSMFISPFPLVKRTIEFFIIRSYVRVQGRSKVCPRSMIPRGCSRKHRKWRRSQF